MIEINSFNYNLMLILTIFLLIIKFAFTTFLLREIVNQRKTKKVFEIDLLFAIFVLILCLFITRLIGFYYDFILTKFDRSKFYNPQNFIIWKIGIFIQAFAFAFFLFITDKKVLNFKFKGIISYIFIAGFILILIYPVSSEEDFWFISIIELISLFIVILVPALYIYIGTVAPEIRKVSFLIAFGIIIYFIGVIIINGFVLDLLKAPIGSNTYLIIYIFYTVLKIAGLFLITLGASHLYLFSYFKYDFLHERKKIVP